MRIFLASLGVAATMAGTAFAAPGYPVSHAVAQANALVRHKDYAAALEVLDMGLRESPRDPVALGTRGYVYIALQDFIRATGDFDLALQFAPTSANALENTCWVRALANTELDHALAYCDESLRLARGSQFAQYDTRGFLRLRRSEFALAVADYDAALKERPKLASSLYGRGIAKLRLGQAADGEADLAAAAKIEPGIAATYAKRGVTP
jgi:tetratricopeptide (TPR) repeat protein